jgi:hypothetical protein
MGLRVSLFTLGERARARVCVCVWCLQVRVFMQSVLFSVLFLCS